MAECNFNIRPFRGSQLKILSYCFTNFLEVAPSEVLILTI